MVMQSWFCPGSRKAFLPCSRRWRAVIATVAQHTSKAVFMYTLDSCQLPPLRAFAHPVQKGV